MSERLRRALDTYDDWMSVPKAVPQPTVAILADAARKVADPDYEAVARLVALNNGFDYDDPGDEYALDDMHAGWFESAYEYVNAALGITEETP